MNFEKWTNDTYILDLFKEYYEKYICQFKPNNRQFVDRVFCEVDYYDDERTDELCQKYAKYISKIPGNKLVISTILDDDFNHNSQLFYRNLATYKITVKRLSILDNLLKYDNIIICDDYSGTGDTMIETISKIYDLFNMANMDDNPDRIKVESWWNSVKIIAFPAIITEMAYRKLTNFLSCLKSVENYEIKYLCYRKAKLFEECETFSFRDYDYINDINKDWNIAKDYAYGYGETGEYIAMFYGIPNNSIGFLWNSKNKDLIPFFSRKPEPRWYKNSDKFKIRDYKSFSFVEETKNYLYFSLTMSEKKVLLYKLIKTDNAEIARILNLTDVDTILNSFIKKNYIKKDGEIGDKIPEKVSKMVSLYLSGIQYSPEKHAIMGLNAHTS